MTDPQPVTPAVPGEARYRKKAIEIEAVQWTGQNLTAVKDFASGAVGAGEVMNGALPLWVVKSQALCHVQRGDWIIREPDGSGFYPCAEAIFAATCEPVSEPVTPPAIAATDDTPRDAPASVAQLREHAGALEDEALGRLVHETRRAFADAHGQKFLLPPWEERHPEQQELDMRLASVVADVVTARVRGRFGEALRIHYLAGITCDHAREEDNPVCACSRVFLGWHPNVGAAVEAWIGHVMEAAGGGEGQERSEEEDVHE